MKNRILFPIILIMFFAGYSFSQSQSFNLKNLDSVSVEIQDTDHLLSSATSQKLLAEIKLHLISAGIKVVNFDESKAQMIIKINYIRSALAGDRVLVQLNIYEKVTTERTDKIKTEAITYNDFSLFKTERTEKGVYAEVMDKLLINFINSYINQKGS